MCDPTLSSRRGFLQAGIAASAWAAAPSWAQGTQSDARLVVVFLRGAVDGVSLLVPTADPDYYAIRPNIAIPQPDGTDKTAIKLNDRFGLHPALASLMPEWEAGTLAMVPSAGLPKPNRSHFDAQYQMEVGSTGKNSGSPGWLNALASAQGATKGVAHALGVGESNPAILAGDAAVRLIPRGQAAQRSGVLANERTRAALLDMYKDEGALGQAFAKGTGSRVQSANELTADRQRRMAAASGAQASMSSSGAQASMTPSMAASGAMPGRDFAREMVAASNGAADPVGLALDAQHLATLMANDPALRIGFLSAGGWDTHANQGAAEGQLAGNLRVTAAGLVSLRKQFNRPNDVVIVMSEFGRTAAENGTRGTDHGYGNTMWLMGQGIQGGKIHGEFTGMAKANLNEARDLPAHHDYRAVLAQLFKRQFAMTDRQLADLLPGASWDAKLDGVVRG